MLFILLCVSVGKEKKCMILKMFWILKNIIAGLPELGQLGTILLFHTSLSEDSGLLFLKKFP